MMPAWARGTVKSNGSARRSAGRRDMMSVMADEDKSALPIVGGKPYDEAEDWENNLLRGLTHKLNPETKKQIDEIVARRRAAAKSPDGDPES
jgi:hypothetical protein